MPDPSNGLAVGLAAAAAAETAALASAEAGVAVGKIGYTLTTQALQDQAVMAFPLILLSAGAIVGGFAAYIAMNAAAAEAISMAAETYRWQQAEVARLAAAQPGG